ncbi:MAG: 3,4-dihydroxy-2-butanone-4-phosphate synthase [Halobacteriaceae archaeon]
MSESSSESALAAARRAFRQGEPVLIHDFDDREAETDLVYPASAVDADAVARLRNDGGGLIFVALSDAVARRFDLPYLHETIEHPATDHDDLPYDAHPSFSLTVNHRDTYTGITDEDRAMTIRALGDAAAAPAETDFAATFRSPGHVHVLRAAPNLLVDRQGHTELGLALAAAADQPPAVAGCEMLDDDSGGALSAADARAYAERTGTPFVDGDALLTALR